MKKKTTPLDLNHFALRIQSKTQLMCVHPYFFQLGKKIKKERSTEFI